MPAPKESDLLVAQRDGDRFSLDPNSAEIETPVESPRRAPMSATMQKGWRSFPPGQAYASTEDGLKGSRACRDSEALEA
jgi:hypothetical protein